MHFIFTEYGGAMFSGVLKSNRAIQVNLSIMRTFWKNSRDPGIEQRVRKPTIGT